MNEPIESRRHDMRRIEGVMRQFFGRGLTEEEEQRFLKNGTFGSGKVGETMADVPKPGKPKKHHGKN